MLVDLYNLGGVLVDLYNLGGGVLVDLFSLAAVCAFQSVIAVCHHHHSLWCTRNNVPSSTIQWASLALEQRTWNALDTLALCRDLHRSFAKTGVVAHQLSFLNMSQ